MCCVTIYGVYKKIFFQKIIVMFDLMSPQYYNWFILPMEVCVKNSIYNKTELKSIFI